VVYTVFSGKQLKSPNLVCTKENIVGIIRFILEMARTFDRLNAAGSLLVQVIKS